MDEPKPDSPSRFVKKSATKARSKAKAKAKGAKARAKGAKAGAPIKPENKVLLKDLREKAASLNIKGYKSMTKTELLSILSGKGESKGEKRRSSTPETIKPTTAHKSKRIYVVHVLASHKDEIFEVDDSVHCDGQRFPYTIKYDTLSVFSPTESDEVQGVWNILKDIRSNTQVLFYISFENIAPDRMDALKDTFLELLVYLTANQPENITVFAQFKFAYFTRGFSKAVVDGYGLDNLRKFINIITEDIPAARHKEMVFKGSLTFKTFEFVDSKKLVCKNWFEYFADIAFGCLKGRLIQISGTCYLNVIVNAFILCPTARKMVLTFMQTQPKEKYKKRLNLGLCKEDVSEDYLFRLMFNVVCSGTPIFQTPSKLDLFEAYNDLYRSDPINPGGNVYFVFPKFVLFLKEDKNFIQYISPISESIIPVKYVGKSRFDIQFCFISFKIVTKSTTGNHVILGYICDGTYKLFDSNGYNGSENWLIDPFNATKRLYKYIPEDSTLSFNRYVAVYIRSSVIKKYEKISTESLCDVLK